jgi:hypothetical protein
LARMLCQGVHAIERHSGSWLASGVDVCPLTRSLTWTPRQNLAGADANYPRFILDRATARSLGYPVRDRESHRRRTERNHVALRRSSIAERGDPA